MNCHCLKLEGLHPKYAEALINEWAYKHAQSIMANHQETEARRECASYIADIAKNTSQQLRKDNGWEQVL